MASAKIRGRTGAVFEKVFIWAVSRESKVAHALFEHTRTELGYAVGPQ